MMNETVIAFLLLILIFIAIYAVHKSHLALIQTKEYAKKHLELSSSSNSELVKANEELRQTRIRFEELLKERQPLETICLDHQCCKDKK